MSGLSLDDFVALNALIVTAMGLSFVGMGRRQRGQRKNLQERPLSRYSNSSYGAAALKKLDEEEQESAADMARPELRAVVNPQILASRPIGDLNVFFNWNGHTWEAYEVLGVPPGSGRETVVGAFHESRAKSPDSTAFFQAATDAILKVQS